MCLTNIGLLVSSLPAHLVGLGPVDPPICVLNGFVVCTRLYIFVLLFTYVIPNVAHAPAYVIICLATFPWSGAFHGWLSLRWRRVF